MYRVLIVDDDASIIELLSMALSEPGVKVNAARTERDAMRIIREERVDLAIIDIHLTPTTNREGYNVLSHLGEVQPEAHGVIVTGAGSTELMLLAYREGAAHYLTKPLDLRELRRCLSLLGFPGLNEADLPPSGSALVWTPCSGQCTC